MWALIGGHSFVATGGQGTAVGPVLEPFGRRNLVLPPPPVNRETKPTGSTPRPTPPMHCQENDDNPHPSEISESSRKLLASVRPRGYS